MDFIAATRKILLLSFDFLTNRCTGSRNKRGNEGAQRKSGRFLLIPEVMAGFITSACAQERRNSRGFDSIWQYIHRFVVALPTGSGRYNTYYFLSIKRRFIRSLDAEATPLHSGMNLVMNPLSIICEYSYRSVVCLFADL